MTLVRHMHPWNLVAVVFFTLFSGVSLGLSSEPLKFWFEYRVGEKALIDSNIKPERPAIYAFGIYVVGLCILSVISIIGSMTKRVIKNVASSLIAAAISTFLFVAWWQFRYKFVPTHWLIVMLIVVDFCLVWLGVICDRLAAKLTVDEYLLPIILVWCDMLIWIMVGFVVLGMMCVVGGDGAAESNAWYYCNCNIALCYEGDKDAADAEVAERVAKEQGGQNPAPEAMGAAQV